MRRSISDKSSVLVSHYTGEAGLRYFEYQSRFGDIAGEVAARKLARHIGSSEVVLDFGCGGGFMLKSITCGQRLGVEINPFARETAENQGITCFETLEQIE